MNTTCRSVVLLACGSFNPPTKAHLRMCQLAREYVEKQLHCEVIECILSPVSDNFGKPDLISAKHRLKMVELAVENFNFIRADSYECTLTKWTKTINVLKYHKIELAKKYPTKTLNLMLLCGGDLIDAFVHKATRPGFLSFLNLMFCFLGQPVWDRQDVIEIIQDFGLVVIDRLGAKTFESLEKLNLSDEIKKNILFVTNFEKEDLSSTKVRNCIRGNLPFRHLTFENVADYIQEHKLYSKPN